MSSRPSGGPRMATWIKVKTSVVAPNTKTSEGERDYIGEFKEAAMGKEILWILDPKDLRQYAQASDYETALSFHKLVPLRKSIVDNAPYDLPEGEDLYDHVGMPLTGHLEERRVWGCKWGAFEVDVGPVRLLPTPSGHRIVTYTYMVPNRYPREMWGTLATVNIDLGFYSSWSWSDAQGRVLHRYGDGYTMSKRRDTTQGDDESGERWTARIQAWKNYMLDSHEEWVADMLSL